MHTIAEIMMGRSMETSFIDASHISPDLAVFEALGLLEIQRRHSKRNNISLRRKDKQRVSVSLYESYSNFSHQQLGFCQLRMVLLFCDAISRTYCVNVLNCTPFTRGFDMELKSGGPHAA